MFSRVRDEHRICKVFRHRPAAFQIAEIDPDPQKGLKQAKRPRRGPCKVFRQANLRGAGIGRKGIESFGMHPTDRPKGGRLLRTMVIIVLLLAGLQILGMADEKSFAGTAKHVNIVIVSVAGTLRLIARQRARDRSSEHPSTPRTVTPTRPACHERALPRKSNGGPCWRSGTRKRLSVPISWRVPVRILE